MSGDGAERCPGEEKEPLALLSTTVAKQESRTCLEQRVSGKTNVPHSLYGEKEAWLRRRHEGTARSGACAPL